MKLTQKSIAAVAIPDGKSEAIFFDDELPGFGLRIRAGGARVWIYQFKIGSQHRRMTMGSLAALSPVRAREIAGELHAQVRLGRDPSAEKAEGRARAAETMGALLQNYLAYQRGHLKPRSMGEIERHLMKNAKPLHGLQLAKVDRRTIAGRLSTIATEKGAVTANRMRAALSAFFAWCIREGLVESNPVVGTNRQAEKSRERVFDDAELKAIWEALGSDNYSMAIRLLMLTGQRLNEIGGLKWCEVVNGTIELPPARTKNGRAHSVPLAAAALALIDGRPRNGEFVFGRSQPLAGWAKRKAALDRRTSEMGGKLAHWTHHDLRRSMATHMAESGTAPHIIEAVLNHVGGHKAGIAGIYNRASYESQKRIALQKWADHIEALVSGKAPGNGRDITRSIISAAGRSAQTLRADLTQATGVSHGKGWRQGYHRVDFAERGNGACRQRLSVA
jgi:integrase